MAQGTDGADSTSDYERIGGGPAVRGVVDRFYELVLGDETLAPFFEGVDMPALRRHQTLFVSQVLGGPADYDGRALNVAHQPLGITDAAFDSVVGHLVAAMQEAGVPEDVLGRAGAAVQGTRPDVVAEAG